MVNHKSMLTVFGAAIVVLVMTASGNAWVNHSRMTHVTFTGPVALPGVTLGGGTYIFELASPTSLDLVRVLSRDRSRVYLTAFTTQVRRPAGMPADRLVSIGESPAGTPAPITAWYPLGDVMGHRFIYGKDVR